MNRSFQVALVRCLVAATALAVCQDRMHVRAAEPSAAPLFADDFSRGELGPAWRVSFPSFSIVDGVLTARQAEGRHSAVGMVKVDGRNLVIEFRF